MYTLDWKRRRQIRHTGTSLTSVNNLASRAPLLRLTMITSALLTHSLKFVIIYLTTIRHAMSHSKATPANTILILKYHSVLSLFGIDVWDWHPEITLLLQAPRRTNKTCCDSGANDRCRWCPTIVRVIWYWTYTYVLVHSNTPVCVLI